MTDFYNVSYLLRKQVGVYLLMFEEIVVYVGKSVNIPVRIREHVKSGRTQFDKVLVQYCTANKLDALEYSTIRDYRPEYNRAHNDDIPEHEPFDLASSKLLRKLEPGSKHKIVPRIPKKLLGGNSPPRAEVVWSLALKGRKGY